MGASNTSLFGIPLLLPVLFVLPRLTRILSPPGHCLRVLLTATGVYPKKRHADDYKLHPVPRVPEKALAIAQIDLPTHSGLTATSSSQSTPTTWMKTSPNSSCASQLHLPAHQGWAGFQSLQLKRVPSNVRQSALLIELTPRPSSDPNRQFGIKGTHIVPRTYVTSRDPLVAADIQCRKERCRHTGGIGTAVVTRY